MSNPLTGLRTVDVLDSSCLRFGPVLPSELLLLLAEVKRSCTREGCLPSVGGLLLFVLDLSNAGVQPELVLTTKGAPS
jgi:hypothetical protein